MISGVVQGLIPIVPLVLEDRGGGLAQFRFAVDTGFNGFLSLPPADLQRLGLTPAGEEVVTLVDGSNQSRRAYRAVVHWRDERHEVRVLETGLPLLGMALLSGNRIAIDVVEGGPVSVEPL